MLMTALSIIIAGLLLLYPSFYPIDLNKYPLPILMTIISTGFLFIVPLINTLFLFPLEKLEQKLIPHLVTRYQKDNSLRIGRLLIFFFIFISFLLAIAFAAIDFPHRVLGFAIWIIALGITIDLLRDSMKRMTHFLDPFYAVDLFTQEAKKSIQTERDPILWNSIDAISEVALQSVVQNKIALSTKSLNAFSPILSTFFASSKSISRINLDEDTEKKTGQDEASYTVFYLLQRLELINSKALENGLGTICSHMMVVLGKIIVLSAQYDLSMVSFPVHVLGKFAARAQQYRYDDVAALGTSTLLEVSKTIINDIDLTYADLKDPFDTIINNLNDIAQATFKKDKNVSIKMIAQPLRELRELFLSEKMANHRDTPEILQHIDSVLAEFEALEQVMRSLPPMPDIIPK